MSALPNPASSQPLDYHCQPCGIDMFTANIASHLAGKKHLKRCAELNARGENEGATVGYDDPASETQQASEPANEPTDLVLEPNLGSQAILQTATSPFTLQSESSTARIYCDACMRQLNTPTGFAAHMSGKTHERILHAKIAAIQSEIRNRAEAISAATSQLSLDPTALWYCSSCKTHIRADDRVEHLGSLLHALGRGEIPTFDAGQVAVQTQPPVERTTALSVDRPPARPQPNVYVDSFHCVPCGRTRNLIGYEGHMASESHRKAMLLFTPATAATEHSATPSMTESNSRADTWLCTTCMVYLHVDARETHLGGKHHIREPVRCALGVRSGDAAQSFVQEKENEELAASSDHTADLADESLGSAASVQDGDVASQDAAGGRTQSVGVWRSKRMVAASISVEDYLRGVLEGETNAGSQAHDGIQKASSDDHEDDGGVGFHNAGATEGSIATGGIDRLNQLARRQELEKAMATMQSERWYCPLCNTDMPATMQEAHELLSFHIRGSEAGGQTVASGSTGASHGPNRAQQPPSELPQSMPPNDPETPFLCHVCLASYSATESHLHSSAPWHCERCNVILHEDNESEHLASDAHRLYQSTPGNPPNPAATPTSQEFFFCLPCGNTFPTAEHIYHISPLYYCDLCKLVMHSDMRDIHEWSPSHNTAVALAKTGPVKEIEWFDCETCNDRFPVSVKPFHRSRAWKCKVCDKVVHMDWIGAHLAGAGHEELARSQSE